MEETQFNVAVGYLSVLLSNLCLDNSLKPHICSKMPGQTLQPIKDAAIEFLEYHRQVDSQLSDVDQRGGSQDVFTERLQKMIERLVEV